MPELDIRQPFTRRQAIAAGITPAHLRGPRFRQLFRGVHICAAVRITDEIRIRAALLTHPAEAFASHHSAAKLYQLPVPHSPVEHVSVLVKSDRRRREGITSHVGAPQRVTAVRGIPVCTPLQLFIDLARFLGLVDLVVLGDAIVRRGLATPEEIVDACTRWEGRHVREARRAAAYVREDVDSSMESRLRMLIILAGLPEPRINCKLRDEMGIVMCRPDLSYPELKIAIEYDGQQHREDLGQWDRDVDREDWLEQRGWRVIKVISRGIYRRPDRTLERICAELERRGCRDLPARLSDEWRAHFPVR